MADINVFPAEARERAGKGAARALRREGRVPAVIYGNKIEPVLISLDPIRLSQELHKPGFFGRVFEVRVGKNRHRVLARDVQFEPVSDRPLHVDFMRFSADTRIQVEVAVNFLNEEEAPGIKRGGVLNVVRREIEMICSPEGIPESITVDLAGLEIGDSVHVSDVDIPEDVELAISDRDFTIATIAAPTAVRDEAAEAAAAAAEEAEGEAEAPAETDAAEEPEAEAEQ